MNPKKFFRIISALIAGTLVSAALMPTSAAAVDIEGTAMPSTVSDTGSLPQDAEIGAAFFDVDPSDWFYEDVMRLAEANVLEGYSDGGFYPERRITNAEFIKLVVAEVADIEHFHVENVLLPEHWASEYINLAYKLGYITDDDLNSGFMPDDPIVRQDMARFVVRALGLDVHEAEEDLFTDTVDEYACTAYREYLIRGYPAENDTRLFNGESFASRGEAAAMVVRVMDYTVDPYRYKCDAILDNASRYALTHEWELIDLFHVLNREFVTEFTFKTPYSYGEWSKIYYLANVKYLEYFYSSYLNCSYIKNSNVYNLTLEYDEDTDILREYHNEVETVAPGAVEKIITDDMTAREKARAIHDYLVLNCKYDYDNYVKGTVSLESRLAYGVLCKGSAVCQGYAAAFNLLARLADVPCEIVTGTAQGNTDLHAWNVVHIDGNDYYIDATHDDPVPDRVGYVSYQYFLRTAEEMTALGYKWG